MPWHTLEGFLSLCASSMTAHCQGIWERKSWSINAMSYVVNKMSKGNSTCQNFQFTHQKQNLFKKQKLLNVEITHTMSLNSHQILVAQLHAQTYACVHFFWFLYLQHIEELLSMEQIWQFLIPNHLSRWEGIIPLWKTWKPKNISIQTCARETDPQFLKSIIQ